MPGVAGLGGGSIPVTGAISVTNFPPSVIRGIAVFRTTTPGTYSIGGGSRTQTIIVVAGTAGASPKFGGYALPVGTYSFSAPPGDTLSAMTLVLSAGDDVLLTAVS